MSSIIFWVEGGSKIGMGHINRCLVIGDQLRKYDLDVVFWINDDLAVKKRVNELKFSYKIFSFNDTLSTEQHAQVVVIDTKKPVSGPLNMLRSLGSRTVLLDNVTEARMHADIVIYPSAVFENSLDWSGFRGKIYFGASYVPIADSFIKAKTERKEPTDTLRKSILVTMGGSDPNRLTYRVVSALLGSKESMKINVVLGPAFPHDERLDAIERQGYDNIKFIRNCSDLSGIMAESHIAITALGTTLYELAYMGVPAIIISNYREDESDMRAFRKLGTALSLGYHEDVSADAIRTATEGIIADGNIREKMSRYAVIDGQGADRIVSIIEELFVKRPDGYKHLMNQEYKDE